MTRRRGAPRRRSGQSLQELMAAAVLLGQIRNALDMQLAGASIRQIADQLDVSEPRAREILEFGSAHQSYLREVDFDLGQLRRIQMERYDALLNANWRTAMGTEVAELAEQAARAVAAGDSDMLGALTSAIENIAENRLKAGKLVLDIMAAQNKMLGVNEEKDVGAVQMPTVIIMSPRPERNMADRQQAAIDVRAELRAQEITDGRSA